TQLPTITDNLTILGNGDFTVSGNNQSRVLQIDPGVTVNISDTTITNGFAPGGTATDSFGGYGGGIINLGTLNITHSTTAGNRASDGGGGIYNVGTLTITNCTISQNQAPLGGGIYNFAVPFLGLGGTLTITSSTISGNQAVNAENTAEGGGIYVLSGSVKLD